MPETTTALAEDYTPAFVRNAFPALMRVTFLDVALWQWIGIAVALAVALLCGYLLVLGLSASLRLLGRRTDNQWQIRILDRCRSPVAMLLALIVFGQLIDLLHLVGRFSVRLDLVARLLGICAFAWLAQRAVRATIDGIEAGLPTADEVRNRGLRTQLVVLNRIAGALIGFIAAAVFLSQFASVRQLGVSLLASAGVVGVVFGFAAQRSLGTLLQGIQLSIAQPIRIGDAIFMEGEFGRVEQIHLTFVVIRLWDLRRLIVPIGRFLEQPFQNWTRVPTHLRGVVELFVDYSTPVDRVREELSRVTQGEPLWNGDVCELQVIDSAPAAVKLRCLVSARTPEDLFDLRCLVREKMIAFLQALDDGLHLPVARNLNLSESKAMSGKPRADGPQALAPSSPKA